MIAYLRNELECIKKQTDPPGVNNNPNAINSLQQPLFFLQNSAPMLNYSYFKPNLSLLSSIPADPPRTTFPEEDSLCLSRDRSKEADSIIHSLLSNDPSLHPLHPLQQRPPRQPPLHSLEESPMYFSSYSDSQGSSPFPKRANRVRWTSKRIKNLVNS